MRRTSLLLVLALVACVDTGQSTTTSDPQTTSSTASPTTTAPPTTVTLSSSTTTAPSTTTTTAQGISQGSCPTVDVILVDETDSLNVRTGPNASASVSFVLAHDETGVMRTAAPPDLSSGSEWWELDEPVTQDTGWANAFYLACVQSGFASDPQPGQVLAGLAQHAAGASGAPAWSTLVSPFGLTVEHFEAAQPVKHWPANQNPFSDGTVHPWATEAGGDNSFQDTFANAVGAVWLDATLNDTQGQSVVGPLADQTQQGAEAAPPWSPSIFTNLHYLSVHDPGDDPQVNGLDWRTVYAYFDWTPGNGWRLRGLSFDSWAP